MLSIIDDQIEIVQETIKQLNDVADLKEFGVKINDTQKELNKLIQLIQKNEGCSYKYTRRVKVFQAEIKTFERQFIQNADYQLFILDGQRLNTLLQKEKVNQQNLKEITQHIKETSQRIDQSLLTNQEKKVFADVLKLIKISEEQVYYQPTLRSTIIKSVYQSQQIQLEEINHVDSKDEEAILEIIEGAQELQKIQKQMNLLIHKQDEQLPQIEERVIQVKTDLKNTQSDLQETLYTAMLIRRKKIKALFSGIFAVIGTYFGGIGVFIGTAIGFKVGSAVAKVDDSAVANELRDQQKQ